MTSRRPLPRREAVERARALLVEVAANDPEGPLARGLARFGSWRALAAIVGTDWLPWPRHRTGRLGALQRRRLRALGAEPPLAAAGLARRGEPVQLRGRCERLAGGGAGQGGGELWRATLVEDDASLWVVDEGGDFLLRSADRPVTLVLAEGGRLVNASSLRAGDEVAVFGVAGTAADTAGLVGAYGRGGLVTTLASDPTHPLLVSVIRRYDQRDHGPQD